MSIVMKTRRAIRIETEKQGVRIMVTVNHERSKKSGEDGKRTFRALSGRKTAYMVPRVCMGGAVFLVGEAICSSRHTF